MSYDIQLFRKEVKEKKLALPAADFFENEENLIPFTSDQAEQLKSRLLGYGYIIEKEGNDVIRFGFKDDEGISALLTKNGLYFSASGEGIFEISMTSSEFTDSGEFVKYDPQNNGWEEI